ncbi:uncharacterized protein LOC132316633 [Cornus florida]|uniref:uncharacterized protein LOC132316633 n=1 Tax=Cornus florida TaxID=4283 RepID=UPI00289F40F3|nr:uncharacterized protein LOC132316633 [Cornus florida]
MGSLPKYNALVGRKMNRVVASHGLVVDGGGEKNGIVGIVVGMVGIEGIVVGMVGIVGSEVAGNGGSDTLGTVGMVGNVGSALLGNGGNVVLGSVGMVGSGVLGNGGNVVLGSVGMAGNGGNVALGRGGMVGIVGSVGVAVGEVCKRLRAAKLIWMLESDNATIKHRMKECLEAAID